MKIKAVIFDLDDTLYPEAEYKRSGFDHVAKIVSSKDFVRDLIDEFDEKDGLPLTDTVEYLVDQYRNHGPKISCFPDTKKSLRKLKRKYKLGLLTNNATGAQQNKLDALGIEHFFDAVVLANPPHTKPSEIPYRRMLKLLGIKPSEAVYVGDDLEQDFISANKLGIVTVQIIRPCPIKRNVVKGKEFKAKHRIKSLLELTIWLEKMESKRS